MPAKRDAVMDAALPWVAEQIGRATGTPWRNLFDLLEAIGPSRDIAFADPVPQRILPVAGHQIRGLPPCGSSVSQMQVVVQEPFAIRTQLAIDSDHLPLMQFRSPQLSGELEDLGMRASRAANATLWYALQRALEPPTIVRGDGAASSLLGLVLKAKRGLGDGQSSIDLLLDEHTYRDLLDQPAAHDDVVGALGGGTIAPLASFAGGDRGGYAIPHPLKRVMVRHLLRADVGWESKGDGGAVVVVDDQILVTWHSTVPHCRLLLPGAPSSPSHP